MPSIEVHMTQCVTVWGRARVKVLTLWLQIRAKVSKDRDSGDVKLGFGIGL